VATDQHVQSHRRVDALGAAFIALASLQFGGVVVLGKIVTDGGLSIPAFLAIRFGVAAAMLVVVLAFGQPLVAARGERVRLALLGMIGYGLEAGLFFGAVREGTAATATFLFFTYPVWVAVVSVVCGGGLPARLVLVALGCAVGGAGLVVISGEGLAISNLGVLMALGSAVTFALYLAGADAVLQETQSLTGALWVSAASAIGLALYAAVSLTAEAPQGLRQWGPVLASAACTAGAFVCLFAGLRRLGAVRTSIVAATEPLVTTVLAVMFLSERLRAGVVGGGLLIVIGAVIAAANRARPHASPVP
jgi:drug/metabolite transporter (DMT)-like permease